MALMASTSIAGGGLDGCVEFAPDLLGKGFQPAHAGEADAVAHNVRKFPLEIHAQEAPQHVDFGPRPFPVLNGKRVQCQCLDPQAAAGLDGVLDYVDTGFVSRGARQTTLPCPAAVAIHDDGDVRGQAVRIDCFRQNPIFAPWLENLEQIFHSG
jgi:hypothetical protein